MMRKMVVLGVALVLSFVLCSVSEAKSLKNGEVYSLLNGTETIEVISDSELDISGVFGTKVAKYGFKDDKLRVVIGDAVIYFEITKEGLKDEKTGQVYYSKAGLAALLEEKKRKVMEELGKTMVLVKGGCYQMGDTFGDGFDNEKPVHEICIADFYMGKYEVTQKEWVTIMGSNPSGFKGCDNCPVESVSWNDIQEFINKLNQKLAPAGIKEGTGKKYRLPTEAEWEYAARSGGKNEKYSGGNDLNSVGWYADNSGSKTHPVGQKNPNGLGLYDMTGNVWEWCSDWYDENYYKNSPKNNPKGADSGQDRVLRGGSWRSDARHARPAVRGWDYPDFRNDFDCGFRCVMTK